VASQSTVKMGLLFSAASTGGQQGRQAGVGTKGRSWQLALQISVQAAGVTEDVYGVSSQLSVHWVCCELYKEAC
jgi:hypothetical protein